MKQSPPNPRKQKALAGINVATSRGLEFGPLDRPLVSKDEGEIHYLDYCSVDELKELYKGTSVRCSEIQNLDYVVQGVSLSEALPQRTFDYILASHVAEHVPDFIGWLQALASSLKDEGIVSLIIPDKRFTFDRHRFVSCPHNFLEAYLSSRDRPSPGQIFDCYSNETNVSPQWGWRDLFGFVAPRTHPAAEQIYNLSKHAWDSELYVNAHCWAWTPLTFLLNLKVFAELGLLDFRVQTFHSTEWNDLEFFVQLQKLPDGMTASEKLEVQIKSLPTGLQHFGETARHFSQLDRVSFSEFRREFFRRVRKKFRIETSRPAQS